MPKSHAQEFLEFAEDKNDLYEWSDKLNEYKRKQVCDHKMYMTEHGIQCIFCLVIWQKGDQ